MTHVGKNSSAVKRKDVFVPSRLIVYHPFYNFLCRQTGRKSCVNDSSPHSNEANGNPNMDLCFQLGEYFFCAKISQVIDFWLMLFTYLVMDMN